MPHVHNEGADLYWTSVGTGSPLLLIMGLSFTHEMWARAIPALEARHRLILFDNRGIGQSSVPRGLYTIPQMARDARAVLQAAGHNSASVIGASMGGMIAQELALRFPEAVKRLVLACTSYSGLCGAWPEWRFVPKPGPLRKLDPVARHERFMPLLYADSTPRYRIEEDNALRSATRWSSAGFRRQLAAVLLWSAYGRLSRVRVPTLIIHGAEDRLIPVANGYELARRIPNAALQVVPKAGHIIMTDQPETCRALLSEFLNQTEAALAFN